MADEAEDKNAREIMADEAEAALEAGIPDRDAQRRYDAAVAQARQREAGERELARLEDRRQYRQFVAGQMFPTLVAKADAHADVRKTADNAVFLADELIAALDRAEALDGAAETEQ